MTARKLACFIVLAAACTSQVRQRESNDDDGGGGVAGGMGEQVGQPPPPPDGAGPGDGARESFAVRTLLMGGRDRNGSPSPTAWRQYGYNIDGLVTSAGSPAHCQPAPGGSPNVMDDGNDGIDNAFGKTIMPLILSLSNDAETLLDAEIASGELTWIFDVVALGAAANYSGLDARAYEGAPMGSTPGFDGLDTWPVTAESLLTPGDVGSPRWRFAASYMNNHTLVLSPRGTFQLNIGGTFPLRLPMQQVIISMELDPDRIAARGGVIAGVVPTEVLLEEMRQIVAGFSPEFCTGPTLESLLDQLRQSSDILSDGTQDPSRPCDAISVGIGFEAVAVNVGAAAAPVPPPPDPCAG